jgi:uncharacterized protein
MAGKKRVWITAFSIIFLFMAYQAGAASGRSCFVHIRGHRFLAEVVDTPDKAVLGLSRREKLRDNEGMLFIYTEKERKSFWMKDMKFDLDILWIEGDKIVRISRNAKAEGSNPSRTYDSGVPVDNVLEINAGLCDRLGIREGLRIGISER